MKRRLLLLTVIAAPGGLAPLPRSGVSQAAGTISTRIECTALFESGLPGVTHVPDFQEIPGAPTRIRSTRIVATSGTGRSTAS